MAVNKGHLDEIDYALAEIAALDAATTVVTELECERPTPRIHCSLTALDDDGFLLFGGEHFDGKKVRVYGDVFRLKFGRDRSAVWTKIISKNCPKARSSHQAVQCQELVYVTGGEFTNSTESHFNHFGDLWSFDPVRLQWKNLSAICKGCLPCPRSGHRAGVWGNCIVVFGGFNDLGKGCKYFNDVHFFDVKTCAWQKLVENKNKSSSGQWPSPRSACGLVVLGDSVFIFGGYSRTGNSVDTGLNTDSRGRVHWDLWRLHLRTRQWESVNIKGPVPEPRAGFSMTGDSASSFVIFGGVHDEYTPDALISDFLDDLHRCHVETGSWEPVTVATGGPQSRMGACLLTHQGQLLLFGGKTDRDDREVTLDDLWVSAPAVAGPRLGAGAANGGQEGPAGHGRLERATAVGFQAVQPLSPACAVWFCDDSDELAESSSGCATSEASDDDDNTLQAYRRQRRPGRGRTAVRFSSPTTSQEGWGDEDWPDPAGLSDRSSSSGGGGA